MTQSSEPTPSGAAVAQPLGPVAYAALAFVGLAIAIAVGWYLLGHATDLRSNNLIPQAYYLILLIFGIAMALFLFGVMRSTATLSGRKFDFALDLGGPVVVAVLVVAGGFYFTQAPATFPLVLRLQGTNGDDPAEMAKGAKLTYSLGTRSGSVGFDSNGEATINDVAAGNASVGVNFQSQTYHLKSPAQLPIVSGQAVVIQIEKVAEAEIQKTKARLDLANKLDDIARQISIEVSGQQLYLSPAIEYYVANPSAAAWEDVKTKAQTEIDVLDSIMGKIAEYDGDQRIAHLIDADAAAQMQLPVPQLDEKAKELWGVLGQDGLPTAEEARGWGDRIRTSREAIEVELGKLVVSLRAEA